MPEVSPLTIAAANAVGPIGDGNESAWFATVKRVAVEMSFLDGEIQESLKALSQAGKPFTGTLIRVDESGRSTRGNVILFTGTEEEVENLPAGHERVQTDRGDTPDGAAMIARCKALIGHKVTVWKVLEKMDDSKGRSFRRLVRIVDNGPDPDRGAPNTQQRPAQQARQERPAQPERPAQQQRPAQQAQQAQQQRPAQNTAAEQPGAEQPQRHLQSVPTPPPAEDEQGWPQVAGQQPSTLDEMEAKNRVLAAAGGDKDKARAAWEHIGNPSTRVSVEALDKALQFVAAS